MENPISRGVEDSRKLLKTLRYWLPLSLVVAAVVFAASLIVLRAIDPVYSSTALIMIQENPGRSLSEGDANSVQVTDPFVVRGEIAILSSDAIARAVVDRLNLLENPEFNPDAPEPDDEDGVLLDENGEVLLGLEIIPARAPDEAGAEASAAGQEVASAPLPGSADPGGPSGSDGEASPGGIDAGVPGAAPAPASDPAATTDAPADELDEETRELRAVLNSYQDRVYLFNDGRSAVVSITVSSENPNLASALANNHADAYFELKGRNIAGSYGAIKEQINAALQRSADELRNTELEIERLRNESGLVLMGSGEQMASLTDEELSILTRAIETAREEESAVRSMLAQLPDEVPVEELYAFGPLQTPAMVTLRQREAEATVNLLRIEANSSTDDPVWQQAERDLAAVRRAMTAELRKTRQGLETELKQVQSKIAMMSERHDELVARRKEQNLARAEIAALQAESQSRRSFYEALQRENEAVLFESSLLGANAKLISEAVPALVANYPPTKLFAALAFVVALGVGASSAFLAEALIGRPRESEEIEERTGLTSLVEVPLRLGDDVRSLQYPVVWQAFRECRTAMRIASTHGCTIISLTNITEDPRDGLLGVGIAKAFAASNMPTLLIDANVARPSVRSALRDAPTDIGLVEVLQNSIPLSNAVFNAGQPNFDVLLAGVMSGGIDTEMTASSQFAAVVSRLRERYGVIIIVTPAMDDAAGMLAVTALADRTILLAPSSRQTVDQLNETSRTLARSGYSPDGFVLMIQRERNTRRRRRRSTGPAASPASSPVGASAASGVPGANVGPRAGPPSRAVAIADPIPFSRERAD